MQDTETVVRNYLLYFVMPFWFLVGFADYWCHRKTKIEQTSGATEALVHLAMLTEIGIPVVLGMYFEINSLIIVFMFAAFVLHEATALWDVAYAQKRREITLFEQHVHSYLAVIPFMVGSLAICLHADQFWALFGLGESLADFSLRLKQPPLSAWVHIALGSGVVLFLALPYTEEFWRCLRFPRVPGERPA